MRGQKRYKAGIQLDLFWCRLSLLMVLALPLGFSPGFPEPSTKTNTPNFDSTRTEDLHENQFRLTWLSFKIYNLLISYLFIFVMIKHICEDEQNKFIPRLIFYSISLVCRRHNR